MASRVSRFFPLLVLFLLVGFLVAAALPAVTYTSVTTFKVSGLVGKILAKAAPDEMREETALSGNRLMTHSGDVRRVVDLDAETITTINDDDASYSVLPFDSLRAMMQQAKSQASGEPAAPDEDEDATNVQVDFTLDRTGKVSTINGLRAEQVFLTIFAEQEEDPEAEDGGGQLILAMELWVSQEAPGYQEMQDFQRRYAEKLGAALFEDDGEQNMLSVLQTIIGNDERLKESLARAEEEAAGLDGMTIRQTSHIITVPAGVTYDAALAFGEKKEEKKKGGGLGGFAKKIAKQAAGAAGGDGEAAQRTLVTTTLDLQDFGSGPVPASSFEPGDGYTRR